MKVLVCFLSFWLIFAGATQAQQATLSDSLSKLKPKQLAHYYAYQLHNGALLVRLKTRTQTIERLKEMGENKLAIEIRQQQFEENKAIMNGFKKQFTFCPVYFFYNNVTDSVLRHHTQGIFLDTNLVVNPSIQLNREFFLIAEEGDLEVDDSYRRDSASTGASVSYTFRSGGIKIMTDKMELVPAPFPSFTNYGKFKDFDKAVAKVNGLIMYIYQSGKKE